MQSKFKSAFTLIELTIVIVIIGLIAGGIAVGTGVLQGAKVKSLTDEIDGIHESVKIFREKYKAYPGDMWDAAERIGNNDPAVINGDGDGLIESPNEQNVREDLAFWQHLALAGLIPGSYDGATEAPGTGLFQSQFDKDVGFVVTSTAQGGIIISASRYTGGAGGSAFISPQDAYSMDKKYDDGNPATGNIQFSTGANNTGNCVSGGDFDKTNKSKACVLNITVERLSTTVAQDPEAATTECPGGSVLGVTRACTCPGGMVGACQETCTAGTTAPYWKVTTYTCGFNDCTGFTTSSNVGSTTISFADTAVGNTAIGTCTGTPGHEPLDQYGNYDNTNAGVSAGTNNGTSPWTSGTSCLNTASPTFPTLTCQSPGGANGWNLGTGNSILGNCAQSRCCAHTYELSGHPGKTVSVSTITESGDTVTLGCPAGFTTVGVGITATCASNVWTYNNTGNCTPNNCAAENADCGSSQTCTYPAAVHGAVSTGTCPVGYAGTPQRTCSYGTLGVRTGDCTAPTSCTTQALNCGGGQTCTFNSVASGATSTATCPSGYSGTPQRPCAAAAWGALSGSCSADACTTQTLDCGAGQNCSFTAIASGSTRTATCPAGYSGTPQRTCTAGSWGAVSNGCTADACTTQSLDCGSSQTCSFTAIASGSTRTATCPAGYSGTPQRTCTAGSWGAVSSGCTPSSCTAQVLSCGPNGKTCTFAATAHGASNTPSCPAGSNPFISAPTRTCSFGSWGALSGGCRITSTTGPYIIDSVTYCPWADSSKFLSTGVTVTAGDYLEFSTAQTWNFGSGSSQQYVVGISGVAQTTITKDGNMWAGSGGVVGFAIADGPTVAQCVDNSGWIGIWFTRYY